MSPDAALRSMHLTCGQWMALPDVIKREYATLLVAIGPDAFTSFKSRPPGRWAPTAAQIAAATNLSAAIDTHCIGLYRSQQILSSIAPGVGPRRNRIDAFAPMKASGEASGPSPDALLGVLAVSSFAAGSLITYLVMKTR